VAGVDPGALLIVGRTSTIANLARTPEDPRIEFRQRVAQPRLISLMTSAGETPAKVLVLSEIAEGIGRGSRTN
jgi:hypothetical protein